MVVSAILHVWRLLSFPLLGTNKYYHFHDKFAVVEVDLLGGNSVNVPGLIDVVVGLVEWAVTVLLCHRCRPNPAHCSILHCTANYPYSTVVLNPLVVAIFVVIDQCSRHLAWLLGPPNFGYSCVLSPGFRPSDYSQSSGVVLSLRGSSSVRPQYPRTLVVDHLPIRTEGRHSDDGHCSGPAGILR